MFKSINIKERTNNTVNCFIQLGLLPFRLTVPLTHNKIKLHVILTHNKKHNLRVSWYMSLALLGLGICYIITPIWDSQSHELLLSILTTWHIKLQSYYHLTQLCYVTYFDKRDFSFEELYTKHCYII